MEKSEKIIETLKRHKKLSGAELSRLTKISVGSLYPLLHKMEDSKELKSFWGNEKFTRTRYYLLNQDDQVEKEVKALLTQARKDVAPIITREREAESITPEIMNMRFR